MQQEYQELRVEKEQLLGKIEDLELQKTTLEPSEKQAQEQEMKLQEKNSSLLENNEENPVELPSKYRQALQQDYDLLEFAINTTEDFKKAVRKMKGACT